MQWRLSTRYDKVAANYLALTQLASIRVWQRVNESTPQEERLPLCRLDRSRGMGPCFRRDDERRTSHRIISATRPIALRSIKSRIACA